MNNYKSYRSSRFSVENVPARCHSGISVKPMALAARFNEHYTDSDSSESSMRADINHSEIIGRNNVTRCWSPFTRPRGVNVRKMCPTPATTPATRVLSRKPWGLETHNSRSHFAHIVPTEAICDKSFNSLNCVGTTVLSVMLFSLLELLTLFNMSSSNDDVFVTHLY